MQTEEIQLGTSINFQKEIQRLKEEKNAVILAHYYQLPQIQELADFVGDSLALAQKAVQTNADIIVFAGVHFMAETAKILNPEKKVLLPDPEASCSLAESCPTERFRDFLASNPDHVVVTYVNCSAEIKALSDIICTSSNAEKIINSIPREKRIIFAPDKNLGLYLQKKTGRELLLWDGVCVVHDTFAIDKILQIHKKYPKAKFIAHPESNEEILRIATFIGSTAAMINFVKEDLGREFIVATEAGILHQMQKEVPDKLLFPAPVIEETSCSCSECSYMKLNTVEKLYRCLLNESPEIILDEEIRQKAVVPLERMFELSK